MISKHASFWPSQQYFPTLSANSEIYLCLLIPLFEREAFAKQPPNLSRDRMSRIPPADSLPPTARGIALLLASTPSVHDAQPGVLHQLLEFSHRYTSLVLSDALVYADHAGRQGRIEMEDVVLAAQARVGWEFGGRVPKEVRRSIQAPPQRRLNHHCSTCYLWQHKRTRRLYHPSLKSLASAFPLQTRPSPPLISISCHTNRHRA
jgi:hypothetical protein